MAEHPTWDFKKLTVDEGKVKMVALDGNQKKKISRYQYWLQRALESQASKPVFSGYSVRGCIGPADGITLRAGNIEYGYHQALHMEEMAVASYRSLHERDQARDIILGIITHKEGSLMGPSGNCRDIILDELGTDVEIVSGPPEGGVATVANFADYLFSDYKKIPRINAQFQEEDLMDNIWKTLRQGENLEYIRQLKNIHGQRRYFASVATSRNLYVGTHDITQDYHPIYALRDAVRQARRSNDAYIRYALVLLPEKYGTQPPEVMYKDRQALYELNLQQELALGKKLDPAVYLVSQQKRGSMACLWKTTVKEWLPFPFILQP